MHDSLCQSKVNRLVPTINTPPECNRANRLVHCAFIMSGEAEEPRKNPREERRRQKELDEARKAGTLAPELDEDGKAINPHIPNYIKDAPCTEFFHLLLSLSIYLRAEALRFPVRGAAWLFAFSLASTSPSSLSLTFPSPSLLGYASTGHASLKHQKKIEFNPKNAESIEGKWYARGQFQVRFSSPSLASLPLSRC